MVIIDVLGLRGGQRTVESHDDLRGLVVNAESLDVDHHRALAQVMAERLSHDRETGRAEGGHGRGVGVLAHDGELRGRIGPGLARVEQAVAVGVADVEAVDQHGRRVEVVGGVGGRAVVVGDRHGVQREGARIADKIGERHRGADEDGRARRRECDLAVGLLDDGDRRRGGEVVADAVGRDRGVAEVAGGRGHDLVLVLAGLRGPLEGVLPVLAGVEQAVLVGVADVEAAAPGRAWG